MDNQTDKPQLSRSSSSASLQEYIQSQQLLENEARDIMPYDHSKCTYDKGPLRQQLYACLTCYKNSGNLNGICYACSINCHTSHELVELFTKRGQTCDCGTSLFEKVNKPCFLRYPLMSSLNTNQFTYDIPDSNNIYNHNFKGNFCSCDLPYNPKTDSNMLQCIFGKQCQEDWYHEECLMGLKPGIINRRKTKPIHKLTIKENKNIDSSDSEDSNDSDDDLLPLPGFPNLDTFDSIICWKCTKLYAQDFNELSSFLNCEKILHIPSVSFDDRLSKINGVKRLKKNYPYTLFLKENFKSVLSNYISDSNNENTKLSKFLNKFSFLYLDDPVYLPDEDSNTDSSVYQLGIQELKNLPNDKAILGLKAYNDIKSKLTDFLKPFAENGKIVTEDEVKDFFSTIKK